MAKVEVKFLLDVGPEATGTDFIHLVQESFWCTDMTTDVSIIEAGSRNLSEEECTELEASLSPSLLREIEIRNFTFSDENITLIAEHFEVDENDVIDWIGDQDLVPITNYDTQQDYDGCRILTFPNGLGIAINEDVL